MRRETAPQALELGDLPVAVVNLILALELDPGKAVISARAQKHVRRKRPEVYAKALPHLARIIETPLYLGDDFKNAGKIEFIGRLPGWNEALLIAVEMERDAHGNYNVATFYPISQAKVNSRREKGFLKSVAAQRKGPLVA